MQNEDTFIENCAANESTSYDIQLRARSTADESSEYFFNTDSYMKHCSWFNFEYKEFGSCTSSGSDSERWDDGMFADSLAAWAIDSEYVIVCNIFL